MATQIKVQSKFTVSEVAKLLGVEDQLERIENVDLDFMVEHEEGETDERYDERRIEAEREAQDRLWHSFLSGLERVFDSIHEDTGLYFLHDEETGYVCVTCEDWLKAARAIMTIIDGDGLCSAGNTVKDFMHQSSVNTPRQVVLHHLHWLKRRAAVYGTSSFSRIVERSIES